MKVNVMKKVLAVAMAACVVIGSGYGTRAMAGIIDKGKKIEAEQGDDAIQKLISWDGISRVIPSESGVVMKTADQPREVESKELISVNDYVSLYDADGLAKYYRIRASEPGLLTVAIGRIDEEGTISYPLITLCNSASTELLPLASMRTDETLGDWGVKCFYINAGTYYIKTQGTEQTVELLQTFFDARKLSTNSIKEKAVTVSPNQSIEGMLAVGSSVTENWYKFTLSSSQPNQLVCL